MKQANKRIQELESQLGALGAKPLSQSPQSAKGSGTVTPPWPGSASASTVKLTRPLCERIMIGMFGESKLTLKGTADSDLEEDCRARILAAGLTAPRLGITTPAAAVTGYGRMLRGIRQERLDQILKTTKP